jgi:O-antigen/teichoic acid export membrane protein
MSVMLTFLINTIFNLIVGLIVAKFLGPGEYGKFALAIAVMTFGQALAFEWIRQCAVRFYSERTRQEAPLVRSTLDAAFFIVTLLFLPLTLALAIFGPEFSLPRDLVALAFAASVANGLFDYGAALVRARFNDGLYLRLIVTKNLLALVLTAGGAWATGSAKVALVAGMSSLLGSLLVWRKGMADGGTGLGEADRLLARQYAGYALPIVAAIVLYQLIPLANRDLAARFFGFAETGRFALAFDLGQRAVQAIGSALDVLLFQIAVRAHDSHGEDHAKEQVARNMAVVFAILAPACVGVWIVLPSVEALIIPEAFRGPFAHFLGLMLPGLFCLALGQFAIGAIFQISRKTWPLVVAALAAALADPVFFLALPRGTDASSLAIAQSLSFAVGLVVLIGFAQANAPQWPRARDLALTVVGCAGMAALNFPLRAAAPGLAPMLLQIVLGGGFYAGMVALFDIAGLRGVFLEKAGTARGWISRKSGLFKVFPPL